MLVEFITSQRFTDNLQHLVFHICSVLDCIAAKIDLDLFIMA